MKGALLLLLLAMPVLAQEREPDTAQELRRLNQQEYFQELRRENEANIYRSERGLPDPDAWMRPDRHDHDDHDEPEDE